MSKMYQVTIIVTAIFSSTLSMSTEALAQVKNNNQATISVPKGISYRVIKVEYVIEPDVVNSGFNDFGTPKLGKFKIEHRLYQEYKNGKVIKTWMKQVKTFVDTLPNQ